MKRKFSIVAVALLALVVLVATACGGDDETTTTAAPVTTAAPTETTAAPTETTAAPTETTAAPTGEVIKLTFSDHNPPDMPVSNALTAYANYIMEQSNGQVQIDLILGGGLMKQTEVVRGIQEGMADAASYTMQRADGFLLNDVMTLPFMGWPSRDETAAIYRELLKKYPEMAAEWEGLTYACIAMMPPNHLHFVDKVVATPADVKGVKAFCTHAVMAEAYTALGGVPVSLDVADMYTSVERGVVDGVLNHLAVLKTFGVLELLTTHTMFGEGGISMAPIGVVWNNDSYNALPDNIKTIVDDAADVWYDTFMTMDAGMIEMCMGIARDANHTFVDLTPEQVAEWRDIVAPVVHSQWLDEVNAAGLPAQTVYDDVLQMISEANK